MAAAVINNLALKKRETINSNFIRYKSLNPAPTYAQSSCRPAPLILHKLRCCYYIFFFLKKNKGNVLQRLAGIEDDAAFRMFLSRKWPEEMRTDLFVYLQQYVRR